MHVGIRQLIMPDWDWLHHWNVLLWKWPKNCLKWTSLVPCDWSKLCCQAWKPGRMGASLTTAVMVVLFLVPSLSFTVLQSLQWRALLRGWRPWCFILISGTKCTFTSWTSWNNIQTAWLGNWLAIRLIFAVAIEQKVMCNCEVIIANGHGKQLNFGKLYKCSNNDYLISSSVQRTPHTKKLSLVPATETTVPPYSKVGESGVFFLWLSNNIAKIIYAVIFHWLAGVLSWNQVPWHHQ